MRLLWIISGLTFLIGFIVFQMLDLIVEFWWFLSLDYGKYFVMRGGYRDALTLLSTVSLSGLFFLNFKLSKKFIAQAQNHPNESQRPSPSGFIQPLLLKSNKFILLLTLGLSVPILIPVYEHWETVLLYLSSTRSGVTDPMYGKDLSFYFFTYPFLQLIQNQLIGICSVFFIMVYATYRLSFKNEFGPIALPKPVKIHLIVLVLVALCLQAWSIALQRIELLYEHPHAPVFYGPGYAEMQFYYPLIWLSFIAFLSATIAMIVYLQTRRGKVLLLGAAATYLLLLGVRELNIIPESLYRFYVSANPVKAQEPYIRNHIKATLHAFDLDRVQSINYPSASFLPAINSQKLERSLKNIPLWENKLLLNMYEQLQGIRPYYDFLQIATDRYWLNDHYQQVNIAARELSSSKLPDEAQTWENRHLNYTHGYGVVVSSVAHTSHQGNAWLLRDLNLNTEFKALQVKRPELFFGLGHYDYAIVPNQTPSSQTKTEQMSGNYAGTGGLSTATVLQKLLLSLYLHETNLLFSRSLRDDSRLLLHRNIFERIQRIAPFLQLEADATPVIVDQKIYWIIDAYTTSDLYPLSLPLASPFVTAETSEASSSSVYNYIRNSVKIIIDAYNGNVDFYLTNPEDPLAQAYNRAYPGLFKSMATLPKAFVEHFSYPQQLFAQQMQVYAHYHHGDPTRLYQQNERLQIARNNNQPVEPFYTVIDPIEAKNWPLSRQEHMVLVSMLSPYGLDNLSMITLAGCLRDDCDQRYSSDILAYKFPNDQQVEGLAQITALIDQSPDITKQFTLWNQSGSKVIRGRITVIPVEERLIYVQPIYLEATSNTGFPQLTRVVVVMNQKAAMGKTLSEAIENLLQPAS